MIATIFWILFAIGYVAGGVYFYFWRARLITAYCNAHEQNHVWCRRAKRMGILYAVGWPWMFPITSMAWHES